MGMIRPPWISKDWFSQCPFNYCDHFGDKKVLAKVSKICKEEAGRIEKYRKLGKDPYVWENIFKDVAENFARTMVMLRRDAKRLGIDLDNIPDRDEEELVHEDFPIYRVVYGYGEMVQQLINKLFPLSDKYRLEQLSKTVDVMSHSRLYVVVKTARALNGKYLREDNEISRELADSKTSAFFAYIAIQRNIKSTLALSHQVKNYFQKEKFLEFSLLSQEVAEQLRQEFFPDDNLIYREIGYEEYDQIFSEQPPKQLLN